MTGTVVRDRRDGGVRARRGGVPHVAENKDA